jgi:hypothetical protein
MNEEEEKSHKLGPWICDEILYDRKGTRIWHTQDPKWLVKENIGDREPEINIEIEFIGREGPHVRNMVEVPADPVARSGPNWYAMRSYTGSILAQGAYARAHWRLLAEHVLNFLEDLHRGHRLVHLDLTQSNVFVDTGACRFVVGDYELLHGIDLAQLLSDTEDDYLWYFVGHGAELDEPNAAWRMDLVMLGYILTRLTWPEENSSDWAFARECERRRRGRANSNLAVFDMRDATLARAHPLVVTYLNRVAALVPWRQVEPPAASVYSELRSLFV